MKNNEFRGPLLQSAAILAAVIILATIAASSGGDGSGGSIYAIFAGIGHTILFVIGLTVGLGFSIAILIGIFLAAVAMCSPHQASQMYSDLKKNFTQGVLTCNNFWSCCDKRNTETPMNSEELSRMSHEMSYLQENNTLLKNTVKTLEGERILFKEKIDDLQSDNSFLKAKIEELSLAVKTLSDSENTIKEQVTDLTTKIQSSTDPEIIVQISKLNSLQSQTHKELESLIERLHALEISLKQPPISGIFAYIASEEHQTMFIEKIESAIKQEMTYSQIDDYLSNELPPDLVKVIKDHPALTKNYIRNLRKE